MWLVVGIIMLLQGFHNYDAVSGILGLLMSIVAFCSALRDAGYFKNIHFTPDE
jgi:hypothetical protein